MQRLRLLAAILAISGLAVMFSCRAEEEAAETPASLEPAPETQSAPAAPAGMDIGAPPNATETAESAPERRVYEAPDATIADLASYYRNRLAELGYQMSEENVAEQEGRLVASKNGRQSTVTLTPRPGGGVLISVE